MTRGLGASAEAGRPLISMGGAPRRGRKSACWPSPRTVTTRRAGEGAQGGGGAVGTKGGATCCVQLTPLQPRSPELTAASFPTGDDHRPASRWAWGWLSLDKYQAHGGPQAALATSLGDRHGPNCLKAGARPSGRSRPSGSSLRGAACAGAGRGGWAQARAGAASFTSAVRLR